jgi:hypothetical protein
MGRSLMLGLAALTFPAMTAAQTQTIPMDLAKALLLGGGNPWDETQYVEIVVGGPPRQWKVEPLKDVRLMGSAAYPNTATVVYEVTGDLRAAERSVFQQFEAAGWTAPPAQPRPPSLESGFVSSIDYYGMATSRRPLCRSDRAAMISGVQIPSGPRFLRVVYMGSTSAALCAPASPRAMRDPWADSPMPRLEAPPNVRVMATGRGGGGDTFTSNGFAFTSMSAEKLFEHYAQQIAAKGWQARGSAADDRTNRVQSWTLKHNGADWSATLLITVVSDQTRVMQLQMYNVTEISKRPF